MKAALIALALAAATICAQQYRISTRDTTITERDTEIETLKGKIETQNHAIEDLKSAGNLENSQAAGRVTTVLLAGERAKRNQTKGTGPKVMNEFMQELYK